MQFVQTQPVWLFPGAEPVEVDGEWAVERGTIAIAALPRGVVAGPDLPQPAKRLRSGAGDAVDHLVRLLDLDGEEGAGHLAEHLRRFGDPGFCIHGRAMWHRGRPSGSSCLASQPTVENAQQFAHQLNGLQRAFAKAWARSSLPQQDVRILADLLEPDQARTVLAELGQGLRSSRLRQTIDLAATAALEDAHVSLGFAWPDRGKSGTGPSLTLQSPSPASMYLLDLISRAGRGTHAVVYACSVCEQQVELVRAPRESDAVYCRRPECQRERHRRNKARQRARLTTEET